jgi:hypothetical protein
MLIPANLSTLMILPIGWDLRSRCELESRHCVAILPCWRFGSVYFAIDVV